MARHHSLSRAYRTMAHLRRFFESVRRTITTEPTDGGLTPAQQFALLTLAGNPSRGPLTVGDLARHTFATMNTTSAYVRLTALGERRLRPSTAAVVHALRAAADQQGRRQLRAAFETWFDDWGGVIEALSSGKPRRVEARRRARAT